MASFSDFSEEDKLLTVSIPYRVGVWISMCDDNATTKYDDKIEGKALEDAFIRMSEQKKHAFGAAMAGHVLSSKKAWRSWQAQAKEDTILVDLDNVLKTCAATLSAEDVAGYKKMIWFVALAVARSYGEQVDPDNEMHVNRFFNKFFGGRSTQKAENISEKEKAALKKLQTFLKS